MAEEAGMQQDGRDYIVFRDFQGMDTQADRLGLDKRMASWMENLQPIAGNNLQSVPGPNAALATIANQTIQSIFGSTINGIDYLMVFTFAGAGYQIRKDTGAVVQFGVNGTFQRPDVTTWKNQRILIADAFTGYSTWDTVVFVKAGGVSPNINVTNGGSGYASAPSVTISGGSGSGATAVAVISGGAVVAVNLTAAGSGYLPGDTLTVTFGSGAATAVARVWPFFGAAGGAVVPSFVITNGGHYYTTAPSVSISGGSGSGLAVVANVSGGAVVGFTVTNSGSGYVAGDVLTVSIAAPPASVQATATAAFGGPLGNVTSTNVTNQGYGYTSVPNVAVAAPGGSNPIQAVITANLTNGKVTSLNIVNAGQGYSSLHPPTLTIDAPPAAVTATATGSIVASGGAGVGGAFTTLAIQFGRVWLGGGRVLQWLGTATNGFDDTNPANAAGFTVLTDSDLAHQITALRALNNYLFIFGDNSVKQIGTITVSGSATLFVLTTLSSDTGTMFPLSVISYNRFVLFANFTGVWKIYGASVEKISDPMDGIFPLIDFTNGVQSLITDINNIRSYMLLVRYVDPVVGPRSIFLTYQRNKQWYVISTDPQVTAATQLFTGGRVLPYTGVIGSVFQMLANPNNSGMFKLSTALDAGGKDMMNKRTLRVGVSQRFGSSGTVSLLSESENGVGNAAPLSTYLLTGAGYTWQNVNTQATGIGLGVTLTGTFISYETTGIVIEYKPSTFMRSSSAQ